MAQRPQWVPGRVDVERPSEARAYDRNLGGSRHHAVDRKSVEPAIATWPQPPEARQVNWAFPRRAVRDAARWCPDEAAEPRTVARVAGYAGVGRTS